jgi:hypothetical protein
MTTPSAVLATTVYIDGANIPWGELDASALTWKPRP